MSFSLTTRNQSSPLGPMPDGWRLVHLKDITTKIGSGATPRGGSKVYLDTRKSYALVRSQHVFDRYFDRQGMVFISDEHAAELSKVALQPRDILLNITGDGITFGRSCIVPDDVLPACVNQHVSIIRTRPEVCLPEYLLSYLTHPEIKGYIESFNAGGSRRAITKGHIESFEVPLPPLDEQKKIAHILGTLDDKIELNQQMNQTLEGIARALFKSWFIDFDPVRAKLDGRQPAGMDAETAALFPDSFEDSPLGKIPKGWKFKPIEELVEGVYDGPHATPKPSETGPVFLGIKNFTGTSLDLANIRHINEEDWPRWTKRVTPQTNDIVFTYEATLGYFALIPDWLRCCLGRRIALIRPKASDSNAHFLFHTFTGSFFQEFLNSHINHGSTVDRILLTEFPSYPVLLPEDTLVTDFENLAGKHWKLIHNNQKQNQELIATRDALLPKLLSGEIRIKDAEQALEAVV
jgi:type I restriction enzyme S subunit